MKQRGPAGGRSSSPKPSAPGSGAGEGPDGRSAPASQKINKASANDRSLDSVIAADKIAALKLAPVSRETEARLDRYIALLREWQAKTNLVAPSTLPHLWTRHIADSLQLVDLAPTARRWADLGSGGGFPGVVLACTMAETPGASVHLVERIAKKAAFLREAIRITTSPGVVHLAEIGDNVDRITGPVDCVTARALAPLHQLIGFAEPLMRQGAKALFPKGQDVEAELTEAAKYWNIQPQLHQSRTGDGWIVELNAAERRG
ncbi:gidB [Bradyrhizobium diazoefficiens USDA 110]|uniref:Ribosomal RNA small subunit methyltransferase G n=1 Tax=Bradyrhizobium diazoefficiens (strain JCM 10833 / BCRC 13528 / IAM 13628 / NBRC 14792 / USDA 110) TaxID=224911 RepID=RSMG_BRADU|nr:RecName: Full=Ribosomal RNA small subunit methyltransferase G; AltName: Full=16S rRNA 7-methylguanosine methyltransferase; Short=16S rRNA m7G methyltransferase [Bradyrhizobium diazoefficiens USDA 110]AWO87775.1 16S rRNA (guanine(527)-N(7))-methyltransferase RsmG [Bradyrhizobium diazoefficiens]MBP1060676.1 16S rRNA (guanine527-N7)-methyltransferase [Bradyrhizobium japonicum]AND93685.1 16S rRNA methyltransferase [Bradyrhizobium diazoefficiens USDA 110]PDT62500.1 ribosomal RNA small subunit met